MQPKRSYPRFSASSVRTVQRPRRQPHDASSATSPTGSCVARLYAFAEDVLGSRAAAETWMRTPNRALDGARPVDDQTEIAAREVEDLLGRIRHGIFA